jgi:uncharacterized protein (DUF433 family)
MSDVRITRKKLVRENYGGEIYEYYPLGKYVVMAPGTCGGRPTFKYTRIEVTILDLLAAGWTIERIVKSYKRPELPREAIVEVEALGEEVPAHEYLNAMWEKAQEQPVKDRKQKAEEVPKIIRVYVPDGDRHVRDLRTGVRTVQVNEVFDGELDEFILAYLKSQEAATAWG